MHLCCVLKFPVLSVGLVAFDFRDFSDRPSVKMKQCVHTSSTPNSRNKSFRLSLQQPWVLTGEESWKRCLWIFVDQTNLISTKSHGSSHAMFDTFCRLRLLSNRNPSLQVANTIFHYISIQQFCWVTVQV